MILDDYDIKNIDELILSLRESLGEQGMKEVMMMSADNPIIKLAKQIMMKQQMMAEQGGAQPPQGAPPQA